jgi:hypothetical protein
MDTKSFLKEIRSIIREEIEYALDKKMKESSSKKPVKETIDHGVSLYKQASKIFSKKQEQRKKPLSSDTSKFSSLQDILEETRRSIQESYDSDSYDEGRTLSFDSNSLNAFANERFGTPNAIPSGVNPNDLAPEVSKALTRDYSALMAKINEKKGA